MNGLRHVARGAGAIGVALVGYSLFGESQAAAVGGVVFIIVAAFAQELSQRRDPRLDPHRVLYLALLLVAGFLAGWGLADRAWGAVVVGMLLMLIAVGLPLPSPWTV